MALVMIFFPYQLFRSRTALGNFGKLRKGEKLGGSSDPPFFLFLPCRLRFFLFFLGLPLNLDLFLELLNDSALLVRVSDDWDWRSSPSIAWKCAAFRWLRTLSPLSKSYVRYFNVNINIFSMSIIKIVFIHIVLRDFGWYCYNYLLY